MTDPGGSRPSEMLRRTILYSGRVQGVGFRYTTREIARGFDVSGYVRNLPDGRVELVAEGTADSVDRFTQAVRGAMHGHITNTDVRETAARGQFPGFEVRF